MKQEIRENWLGDLRLFERQPGQGDEPTQTQTEPADQRDFFGHLYTGDTDTLDSGSVPEDYYSYLEGWYRYAIIDVETLVWLSIWFPIVLLVWLSPLSSI